MTTKLSPRSDVDAECASNTTSLDKIVPAELLTSDSFIWFLTTVCLWVLCVAMLLVVLYKEGRYTKLTKCLKRFLKIDTDTSLQKEVTNTTDSRRSVVSFRKRAASVLGLPNIQVDIGEGCSEEHVGCNCAFHDNDTGLLRLGRPSEVFTSQDDVEVDNSTRMDIGVSADEGACVDVDEFDIISITSSFVDIPSPTNSLRGSPTPNLCLSTNVQEELSIAEMDNSKSGGSCSGCSHVDGVEKISKASFDMPPKADIILDM